MTKAEAAVALGVSVRSVERLVASGRLKQGRSLAGDRRVASYDAREVEDLRSSITAGARPKLNVATPYATGAASSTVSFRLSPIHAEQLRREGEPLGLSAGEVARLHTVRAIERGNEDAVAARELRRLREALAETFFNFLVLKCDTPKSDARRFVRENLLGD